jgi:hypothetical protein
LRSLPCDARGSTAGVIWQGLLMKNDSKLNDYYDTHHLETWKQVREFYQDFFGSKDEVLVFRGHGSSEYILKSTLERTIEEFGLDFSMAYQYEKILLRRFRGSAHLYDQSMPEEEDILGWWALMRNYGAPTRLLDWTYSFFVAAYFALESASGENAKKPSHPAIWALKSEGWSRVVHEGLNIDFDKREPIDSDPKLFQKHFFSPGGHPIPLSCPVNPLRLSQRHTVQQGIFLCSTSSNIPFINAFKATREKGAPKPVKIIINNGARKDGLHDLYRMNINRASLYPGLAGFAESLRFNLAKPEVFRTIR